MKFGQEVCLQAQTYKDIIPNISRGNARRSARVWALADVQPNKGRMPRGKHKGVAGKGIRHAIRYVRMRRQYARGSRTVPLMPTHRKASNA